jgi:hypothetical protein
MSRSDADVRHQPSTPQVSEQVLGIPTAGQRAVRVYDHVSDADRRRVEALVAALLEAKQKMVQAGEVEPSWIRVAEALTKADVRDV